MKLLFENWRNYLTEAKEKYIDPGQDQDVAEYEDLFLQYREEFIETVILSRKKELDKLIEDLLGPKRSKLVPTPWLLEQIVKVIRNTKIVFMAGSAPTEDPDYGGPAFFHSGKNLITVEQFHKYWLRDGSSNYKGMIYHEIGHALDRAVMVALKKSKNWKLPKDIAPSFWGEFAQSFKQIFGISTARAGGADTSKRWYSQTQYEKLRQIANKRLSPTPTGKHEEDVVEFFASLRELHNTLGRNILPIDIEYSCFLRTDKLLGGQSIRRNTKEEWAAIDHAATWALRILDINRDHPKLGLSDETPTSSPGSNSPWAEAYEAFDTKTVSGPPSPSARATRAALIKDAYSTGWLSSGEIEKFEKFWGKDGTYKASPNTSYHSSPRSRVEADLSRAWANSLPRGEKGHRRRKAAQTQLTHSEAMDMIDCEKDPRQVAEILNELI